MSYKFGKRSLTNISQCHPVLQKLAEKAIETASRDFAIICGHRGMEEQNRAYSEGKSKLRFPKSKHNKSPSEAFDFCPWPVDWNDTDAFQQLADHFLKTFDEMEESEEWAISAGANWQKFKDFPHIEIRKR